MSATIHLVVNTHGSIAGTTTVFDQVVLLLAAGD